MKAVAALLGTIVAAVAAAPAPPPTPHAHVRPRPSPTIASVYSSVDCAYSCISGVSASSETYPHAVEMLMRSCSDALRTSSGYVGTIDDHVATDADLTLRVSWQQQASISCHLGADKHIVVSFRMVEPSPQPSCTNDPVPLLPPGTTWIQVAPCHSSTYQFGDPIPIKVPIPDVTPAVLHIFNTPAPYNHSLDVPTPSLSASPIP